MSHQTFSPLHEQSGYIPPSRPIPQDIQNLSRSVRYNSSSEHEYNSKFRYSPEQVANNRHFEHKMKERIELSKLIPTGSDMMRNINKLSILTGKDNDYRILFGDGNSVPSGEVSVLYPTNVEEKINIREMAEQYGDEFYNNIHFVRPITINTNLSKLIVVILWKDGSRTVSTMIYQSDHLGKMTELTTRSLDYDWFTIAVVDIPFSNANLRDPPRHVMETIKGRFSDIESTSTISEAGGHEFFDLLMDFLSILG